jgi:predicted membrane metal-binding protein
MFDSVPNIFQEWNSYTLFFYLGIFLFFSNIIVYGFGIDLSYFGLLLIWIGWRKPDLYGWMFWVLWILLIIDIFATFYRLENVVQYIFNRNPENIIETNQNIEKDSEVTNDSDSEEDTALDEHDD